MKISFLIVCCLASFTVSSQPKLDKKDWLTISENSYSVKYPGNWDIDRSGQMDTSFIIFAKQSSVEDKFRENVNLLIQNLSGLNIDLDKYVEISEGQIKTLITNGHILESKRLNAEGVPFHKEIYSGDQGTFKLKFEQYYWVKDEKAYVITFTTEINQFDSYKEIGEEILKSFKLL
jgi:hypothetical protein